jgi:hypothetical protein
MKININVKRNYKINGKEYKSIDEMPDNIREAFQKAMAVSPISERKTNFAEKSAKIVFNDTEYKSIDAMPQDVRRLYEKILKAAETGETSSVIDITEIGKEISSGKKPSGTDPLRELRPQLTIDSRFSFKRLMVSVVLVTLIAVLYFFFKKI